MKAEAIDGDGERLWHTVSGAGGSLWGQAKVEQGLQGLCFKAEQGGSWTNCVCPQEIRDAGGLPGSGGGPCGPARRQDAGATQQRPPHSEAVQPQPAQGGEAWLLSRTSSQLCKLSCFFLSHFPLLLPHASLFHSRSFSLFPLTPALPLHGLGPLALKMQQPFHPLGARGFSTVWTGSVHRNATALWGTI